MSSDSAAGIELGDYQPIADPSVFVDGAQLGAPIIASAAVVVPSTGAFGTYALNFAPVVFGSPPRVIAWCGMTSGGSFAHLSLVAVTALLFQFNIESFAPGQTAIPAGQTVVVEWLAIGS